MFAGLAQTKNPAHPRETKTNWLMGSLNPAYRNKDVILRNSLIGASLTFSPRFTAYLTEDELTLKLGDQNYSWPLVAIAEIELRPGIVWAAAQIKTLNGDDVKLDGIEKIEGDRWQGVFKSLQLKCLATAGKEALADYAKWSKRIISRLPNSWHPSWMGDHLASTKPTAELKCGLTVKAIASHPLIVEASKAYPSILPTPPISPAQGLNAHLSKLNETLFEQHKSLSLFDTLEATPLTMEQRRAVICFDSKLMLVAAAGSGKTATMVAKAAYAIATGIAKPHEILMLAFNTDAAEELQQRLAKRLGQYPDADQIACKTFHGFGLSVIGEATGSKPRPAPWLESSQDIAKVVALMQALDQSDASFHSDLMLVRTVFARPIGGAPGTVTSPQSDDDELVTSRGEKVKSREEQLIADWLFFHWVDYQYEAPYPVNTADAQHSQYHPDFYYPQIKLFHEHFALDAHGVPPMEFKGYAQGVTWKRALHQQHETDLFETTSHTLRTGEGLPALQHALESRGVILKPDPDRIPTGRPPLEYEALARIIRNLIQHAKGNHLTPSELSERAAKVDPIRGPLIIRLYERVLEHWQAELMAGGTVDFDDMINLAIDHAESGRYRSPYKLVIADEYQDASAARARLLRAITVRPDTFLTAVGDDAQSINRFAGADISVMRNFQAFYGSGTVLQLTQTFRCPEEICKISSDFVQQNPLQLKKEVKTTSTVTGKVLQCYAAKSDDELLELVESTLTRIAAKLKTVWDLPPKPTIMLLGRYRSDRPYNMPELKRICGPNIEINFTTVHSSKGTEADYVLILNVTRGRKGFPSEIADDPILQAAMPLPEEFPFAEERRLFYVALTRARRGVFIYTLEFRRSAFLDELAKKGQITIIGHDGVSVSSEPCPACGSGFRKLRSGRYGEFYGCSRYPTCRWTQNLATPR